MKDINRSIIPHDTQCTSQLQELANVITEHLHANQL